MSEPLLSEPVYEEILHDIQPDDQPVFLGGDRLLVWNRETGKYCISLIDASLQKGTFIIDPVFQSGALKDHTGSSLVWFGSNRILAYHPKTGEGTTLSYNRDDEKYDPIIPDPIQTRIPLPPGSEVIYIGQDRLLCLSPGRECTVISTASISGLKPPLPSKKKIPDLSDRIIDPFDKKTALPETYTLDIPDILAKAKYLEAAWLGDDQLAVWDGSSGAGFVGLCEGKIFIPEQEFSMEISGFRPQYIGYNYILVTGMQKSLIKIYKNRARIEINRYLRDHTNVRDAIAWHSNGREIPYLDWGSSSHPETRSFYGRLVNYYYAIRRGGHPVFNFSTDPAFNLVHNAAPLDGIAPGSIGTYFKTEDASQIYLAHIAQSLAIERSHSVSWHLHDYSESDLRLLLRGSNMFTEGTGALRGLYRVNNAINGCGTPGDPVKGYQFLNGSSMIRTNQRETIMELFRWMRDHLTHGPWIDDGRVITPINGGAMGLSAYGYAGEAPIEKIFTRAGFTIPERGQDPVRPRVDYASKNYAWVGCHSATALVVWLMRTINIPCRGHETFISDNQTVGQDHGIDFPSEQLFSTHSDNFYAIPMFMDPTIEPLVVFEHDANYQPMKALYLIAPAPGVHRTEEHNRAMARKALSHPTFDFVYAYWSDKILGNQSTAFQVLLTGNGFDRSEVEGIREEFRSRLEGAITSFLAAHNLSTPREPGSNATDNDRSRYQEQCYPQLQQYRADHMAWCNAR